MDHLYVSQLLVESGRGTEFVLFAEKRVGTGGYLEAKSKKRRKLTDRCYCYESWGRVQEGAVIGTDDGSEAP